MSSVQSELMKLHKEHIMGKDISGRMNNLQPRGVDIEAISQYISGDSIYKAGDFLSEAIRHTPDQLIRLPFCPSHTGYGAESKTIIIDADYAGHQIFEKAKDTTVITLGDVGNLVGKGSYRCNVVVGGNAGNSFFDAASDGVARIRGNIGENVARPSINCSVFDANGKLITDR